MERGTLSNGTPKTYLVASAKGGVGKTSVVVGLGCCFAQNGLRTLAVDLDFDNRCLDLVAGVQDRVMYHLLDVLNGTPLDRAVIRDSEEPNLCYLAAPSGKRPSADEEEALGAFLREAKASGEYDVILLDTPGSYDSTVLCAAKAADCALIVATEQQTSIRAAEATAAVLEDAGISERFLIVNCFDPGKKRREKTEKWVRLIEYIDTTSLRLVGVIPFDRNLWGWQNEGRLPSDPVMKKTGLYQAFQNIAGRLCGKDIPIRF